MEKKTNTAKKATMSKAEKDLWKVKKEMKMACSNQDCAKLLNKAIEARVDQRIKQCRKQHEAVRIANGTIILLSICAGWLFALSTLYIGQALFR